MHLPYAISDSLLAGQALGFIGNLALSLLLIRLILRSWEFRPQRTPGLLLAGSLLLWNAGGLANNLLVISGHDFHSRPPKLVCAVGHTGLAFMAWAVLLVWRLSLESTLARRLNTLLQGIAGVCGLFLSALLWADALGLPLPLTSMDIRVAIGVIFYLLVVAGTALTWNSRATTPLRVSLALTCLAAVAPALMLVLLPFYARLPAALGTAIAILQEQSASLVALAAFILLAKLRFTDTLVTWVLRWLAAFAAGTLAWIFLKGELSLTHISGSFHLRAAQDVLSACVVALLLLCFPHFNRGVQWLVERKLFRQDDLEEALAAFLQSARRLTDERALLQSAGSALDRPFAPSQISFMPRADVEAVTGNLDLLTFDSFNTGVNRLLCPTSDPDLQMFFPVRVNGRVLHVLSIARTRRQRSLLTSEIDYVRRLCDHLAFRLETLHSEAQRFAEERRTTKLLQQAAEAELRALRAQINPHFLFNALNTIADLIVVEPTKAERMTERLAEVFRYVLTQSQQPTISVADEMTFLRRYLDLEKARFGDRLQVEIDVDPAISTECIPSLILQPIVENALKHGLAPKLGCGCLSIRAMEENGQIRLAVEDNGIGPEAATAREKRGESSGIGLKNIAERLKTLYQERASLSLESLGSCGCRVTILIPKAAC